MKRVTLKNGQDMIIRDALKEDAQPLIDYVQAIAGESDFLTFGAGEFNITVEREEAIITESLQGESTLYAIAELDGKIVGNVNFHGGPRKRTRHAGEFGISVLKEYWGLGIGRELIIYMIEWAKESGIIKKINLRVREDNTRGQKLYESFGFKKEGIITRDFLVNGEYYSSIAMGMELE